MKFLIIVIVALAVAFVGGAKFGIIEVPGLSPAAKKKSEAAKAYSSDSDKVAEKKTSTKQIAEAKKSTAPTGSSAMTTGSEKTSTAAQDTSEAIAKPQVAGNKNSQLVEEQSKPRVSPGSGAVAQKPETPQTKPAVPSQTLAQSNPTQSKTAQSKPVDVDPLAGQKQLAEIWKKMEAVALVKIVESWKDDEVAKQFSVMSPKQVAEVLSLMKPERASKLSKQIQVIAQNDAKKAAETNGKKAS